MPDVWPSVSVVMSVHNDADRLERAVRSILEQDYEDLELIAIDDGSTDATAQVLDRIAATDPRLVVVHQENRGLTRSLVRACQLARGEFIARQDSDDWSHPARLREQAGLLRADEKVGFVSCSTQYVGPGDEPLTAIQRHAESQRATDALLHEREGPPAHGSVMFRKSLYQDVGGYRPEFLYSQDSDLWLRMAARARIAYLPAVRYFHRKEPSSTSGSHREAQSRFAEIAHRCRSARDAGEDEGQLLSEATELARQLREGNRPAARDGALEIDYLLGSQLARNRDPRARRYLARVLRKRPWHMKAWLRLAQSMLTARRA